MENSPFRARMFMAGKASLELARDILALDQDQFSALFRKSPMKRAKHGGLKRNAVVVVGNVGGTTDACMLDAAPSDEPPPTRRRALVQ
ncbi:MAG: hypothetical protein IT355_13265 [Gemmatimonadaceae bacterium]|nr:hypothetical protein [Gemmatimonadaceae bacterium]